MILARDWLHEGRVGDRVIRLLSLVILPDDGVLSHTTVSGALAVSWFAPGLISAIPVSYIFPPW
jgi:hypothetical protein